MIADFILKDKANRSWLITALACIAVQFVVFKLCYPFPSFFIDSYTYLDAAANNYAISYRPIGYSKFLQLVHFFSASDTFLTCLQYLLIQLPVLWLFFSIRYFFNLSRIASIIGFIFLVFNPSALYISNYISSDALFTGLSLVWVNQLLWMKNRPHKYQLLLHALLLYILFEIRYNALYYPLVSFFAFIMWRQKWRMRIAGIILSVSVLLAAVAITKYQNKKETGTAVFSAFGGWQLANNALYVYPHITVRSERLPMQCQELDSMVKGFFHSETPVKRIPDVYGTWFMWDNASPLRTFMSYYSGRFNIKNDFDQWNLVAPIFNKYGITIIKDHPWAFTKYYLWPSAKNYFHPILGELSSYNEEKSYVEEDARNWFKYKDNSVHAIPGKVQVAVLSPSSYLFLAVHILFWGSFILLLLKRKKVFNDKNFQKTALLIAFLLAINTCFSIFTTPAILRYQLLPFILYLAFTTLFLDRLFRKGDQLISSPS